jgi:type I restriction enzyme S subunit
MTDKRKVPEIRFKGFSGEWEEKGLGTDVAEIIGGGTPSTLIPEYWNGDIDWYSPSEIGKKIYAKGSVKKITELGLKNCSAKLLPSDKTILFTSRAGIGDMAILQRSGSTNQGFQSLILKDGYDTYFIYSIGFLIKTYAEKYSSGSTFLEISGKKLGQMLVYAPLTVEQSKIGTFFQNLDSLITLQQRKHDKLTNVKKAMLKKMFPKDGDDAPEIRFNGFPEKWEPRTLGEITTPFAEPVPTPKDGYWRLGIRCHAKGTFHNFVQPGRELETAKMHKVRANNFIVNITFAWEHAVAITDGSDEEKLVSHRFPQFSFNEGMVPEYFKYLIIDKRFKYHLWLSSPGGAGRNRVLKISEMLEYPFWVPNEAEQSKIADFFQNLDSLIALQQCELDKLKNLKKSCLERMFV